MPEGSDEQKNLMGEPVDTTMGDFSDAKGGYKPYEEEPAEENIPQTAKPPFGADEENWFNKGGAKQDQQQAQLNEQQQAEAAMALESGKQRQMLQIQRERLELENQLAELEKDLTTFRNQQQSPFLRIFQPKIKLLIDSLIADMQKGAGKLTNEARVGYYTGLIITATTLIGLLSGLKIFAAFFDAFFSWLKKAVPSCVTCVGCIIFLVIAPFYIVFFALLFMLGTIPLLKGKQTKTIADLITKLKKQRDAWQAELDKTKKKVTLRKQIKELSKFEQQVQKRR